MVPGHHAGRRIHSYTARVGTLYPRSRGWVKLRSADPADPPRILFNLFKEREDVDDNDPRAPHHARDLPHRAASAA